MEKFGGYKTYVEERIGRRERLALQKKAEEEEHLEIYGGLIEEIGTTPYFHGAMSYAKTLKPQFRVRDLDLPERRGIPVV